MNDALERIRAALAAMEAAPAGSRAGMAALQSALLAITESGGRHILAKWPNADCTVDEKSEQVKWLAGSIRHLNFSLNELSRDLADVGRRRKPERFQPKRPEGMQRTCATHSGMALLWLSDLVDLVNIGGDKAAALGVEKEKFDKRLPFSRGSVDNWQGLVTGLGSDARREAIWGMTLEAIVEQIHATYKTYQDAEACQA